MINLVIVDMQNDFMDNGALPVKGGYKARDIVEHYIEDHYDELGITIMSLDFHPENHCSFKENGGTFPPHCLQYTHGSKLSFDRTLLNGVLRFYLHKGSKYNREQFSAFKNCYKCSNHYITLEDDQGDIEHLNINDEYVVCGVAGDICVLETLKDMIEYIPVENITVLWHGTASLDGGAKLEQFCTDNEIKIDYYGKEYTEVD